MEQVFYRALAPAALLIALAAVALVVYVLATDRSVRLFGLDFGPSNHRTDTTTSAAKAYRSKHPSLSTAIVPRTGSLSECYNRILSSMKTSDWRMGASYPTLATIEGFRENVTVMIRCFPQSDHIVIVTAGDKPADLDGSARTDSGIVYWYERLGE